MNITSFKKGNIPHNKGIQSEKKLKKVEKFHLGLPVECKVHGEHDKWRMHSNNNVQCLKCAAQWQREAKRKDPLRVILKDAKQHAKIGKREFNISLDDLSHLMEIQEGKCALCGIKFDESNLPSLDRINSALGYVVDNIQLVLIKINRMKTNLFQDEFLDLCFRVYETRKNERN